MIAPPDFMRDAISRAEEVEYARRERIFFYGFVVGVLWSLMVAGVIWWSR